MYFRQSPQLLGLKGRLEGSENRNFCSSQFFIISSVLKVGSEWFCVSSCDFTLAVCVKFHVGEVLIFTDCALNSA